MRGSRPTPSLPFPPLILPNTFGPAFLLVEKWDKHAAVAVRSYRHFSSLAELD